MAVPVALLRVVLSEDVYAVLLLTLALLYMSRNAGCAAVHVCDNRNSGGHGFHACSCLRLEQSVIPLSRSAHRIQTSAFIQSSLWSDQSSALNIRSHL